MANCFYTPHSRSANVIRADTETVTSTDGQRRVTFRNAKRALPNHRYDVVRVAQLKRLVRGRWKIEISGMSEEHGRAFLRG